MKPKKEEKIYFGENRFILLLEDESSKATLVAPDYIKVALEYTSKGMAEGGYYGTISTEIATLAASLVVADPSGSIMKILINFKLITFLGMLNVNYGESLETFLVGSGKKYFPKSKMTKTEI